MLRKAQYVYVWRCKNQNASTTIKSDAALVSNEKLMSVANTEHFPLIRVLVPASCPWEDC